MKISNLYILLISLLIILSIDFVIAQESNSNENKTNYNLSRNLSYRDRLIDYADIYSYELIPNSKDTILYLRKINDYWWGIFGSANFGVSFGNFRAKVDPNNPQNIFNTIVDFYGKFGTGYSLGIMGEWMLPNSDLSTGLKLSLWEKKISRVGSKDVTIENFEHTYLDSALDFRASLSYFTLAPYIKYTFPFFDGFFVTGGFDFAIAYSTTSYLERNYENTGDISHRMEVPNTKGNTRFLLNLGVGYDFFIADFFSKKNRVRVTPFAEFKAGTSVITSNGSNWNDVVTSLGLQFKLAPDIVSVDTLIYDPKNEIPIDYFADIRTEEGVEFAGFTPKLIIPPAFELTVVPETPVDIAVNVPDKVPDISVEIPDKNVLPEASPIFKVTLGDTSLIDGFGTSSSTALDNRMKAKLDEYVKYLKENPNTIVRLAGHSDNRGTFQQNVDRGNARGSAVFDYLVSKGISKGRIFMERGKGSSFPKATNTTDAGRTKNRRVAIVIESGRNR